MENQITRESVVTELRKIATTGVTHPDDLDPADPEVKKAQELFFAYTRQEKEKAKTIGTIQAEIESSLDLSTLEADAGFTDPDYLDEVANDWLAQDEQDALDNNLLDLAQRIKIKADSLNSLIK